MTFLFVIHLLICAFLVAVILIQPGKGDAGIGFGSSSQSIFGSKGAGNFLTKTTSVFAVVFLLTSFYLTRDRVQEASSSVVDRVPEAGETVPVAPDTKVDPAESGVPAPDEPKK